MFRIAKRWMSTKPVMQAHVTIKHLESNRVSIKLLPYKGVATKFMAKHLGYSDFVLGRLELIIELDQPITDTQQKYDCKIYSDLLNTHFKRFNRILDERDPTHEDNHESNKNPFLL